MRYFRPQILDEQLAIVCFSFVFVYAVGVDILTDELAQARARGAVFSVVGRTAPWGLEFSGTRPLTCHLLVQGEGVLDLPDAPPITLHALDVVLVTAGAPYRLVSELGSDAEPIAQARRRGSDPGDLSEADAVILCGAYALEGSIGTSLLRALPRVVVIEAAHLEPGHKAAVNLLTVEASYEGSGQQAILDRLLDVNLVYALRAWWKQPGAQPPGWYRAGADPGLGRVLERVHADPAMAWSVPEMARVAGMSRAAFSARFTAIVGRPPGQYLTGLRMRRAEDALTRTNAPIARIAEDVGYGNEYAFATAFRRHHGTPPGKWRDEHGEGRNARSQRKGTTTANTATQTDH